MEAAESSERSAAMWELVACIAVYSACSAMLLVVNKVNHAGARAAALSAAHSLPAQQWRS